METCSPRERHFVYCILQKQQQAVYETTADVVLDSKIKLNLSHSCGWIDREKCQRLQQPWQWCCLCLDRSRPPLKPRVLIWTASWRQWTQMGKGAEGKCCEIPEMTSFLSSPRPTTSCHIAQTRTYTTRASPLPPSVSWATPRKTADTRSHIASLQHTCWSCPQSSRRALNPKIAERKGRKQPSLNWRMHALWQICVTLWRRPSLLRFAGARARAPGSTPGVVGIV